MFIGVMLVLLGALMLLDRLGIIYGNFWDYFWPACIIAVGISMMFRHRQCKMQ